MTITSLWPIERRVLEYLAARPFADRVDVVCDLSSPTSRIGRGYINGSNAGIPRIMGSWCRRLTKAGAVLMIQRDGFYSHHIITGEGHRLLKEAS